MMQEKWWNRNGKIPSRFQNIELHAYVVMPNHFHSILEIIEPNDNVGASLVDAQNPVNDAQNPIQLGQPQGIAPTDARKTVGDMVGGFQSIVTVEYIRGVKRFGWKRFDGKLWQRNYWEHVIRNQASYDNISNYIVNNPQNWREDKFYEF